MSFNKLLGIQDLMLVKLCSLWSPLRFRERAFRLETAAEGFPVASLWGLFLFLFAAESPAAPEGPQPGAAWRADRFRNFAEVGLNAPAEVISREQSARGQKLGPPNPARRDGL